MNEGKVKKVMHEWKEGDLHSGSKKGPLVKDRKQAIAIGLAEAKHAKTKALHHKKDFYGKGSKKTETVHHMHKRHEAEDASFDKAFKERFNK